MFIESACEDRFSLTGSRHGIRIYLVTHVSSVLIDGNNLLFAAWDAEPERPVGRGALCRRLGDWARRKKRRVCVVFDGPEPGKELSAQIGDPDVAVIFSGPGVSADSVIMERILADSAPRRLLVVSSDRAIAAAARRRSARTEKSADFLRRLARDTAPRAGRAAPEPREKRVGLEEEGATREWLREWGLDGEGGDSVR